MADDHPIYREGLVRAVAAWPEFEVVGEAGDGGQALSEIADMEPDVALIDLHMPSLDGLQILGALQRDGHPTRVVMISGDLSSELVYRAISSGAAGYLPKEATPRRICDAIAAVGRGDTVLPPEVQGGIADEIRRHHPSERPLLSNREHEVLTMTANGRSAPEIATDLSLSPATVRSHLQSVYDKLGVSDRAAAVAEAMRRGLVE